MHDSSPKWKCQYFKQQTNSKPDRRGALVREAKINIKPYSHLPIYVALSENISQAA